MDITFNGVMVGLIALLALGFLMFITWVIDPLVPILTAFWQNAVAMIGTLVVVYGVVRLTLMVEALL